MALIEFGKKVPIRLLISDLNATRFVQAKVYDNNSVLIHTFNLVNLGNGLYTYENYTMPNLEFVAVVYTVYNDPDYSLVDTQYTSDIDVMVKVSNEYLETLIRNKAQNLSQVYAEIEAKNISGSIEVGKKIEGEISQNILEHDILKLKIEGELDLDQLEGTI